MIVIRLLSAMILLVVPMVILALSSQEDLTLDGYKKHLESQNAAPPLTDAEHELKLLRESEVSAWGTLASTL